jgi:hypothetical protein
MKQTGHRSAAAVPRYISGGSLFSGERDRKSQAQVRAVCKPIAIPWAIYVGGLFRRFARSDELFGLVISFNPADYRD